MTVRTACFIMAALTISAMAVGAAVMQAPAPPLLLAAEGLKVLSGGVSWWIARRTGDRLGLGRAGAALIALAGLLGFAAILGPLPALAGAITPTALAGLVATGLWGVVLGERPPLTALRVLGAVIAVAAAVTFFAPPVGMLAALAGIAFWFTASRKLPG